MQTPILQMNLEIFLLLNQISELVTRCSGGVELEAIDSNLVEKQGGKFDLGTSKSSALNR